jgi:hypothetical protein
MQPKIELAQAVELADFGLDEFLSQLSADSISIFLGDLLDMRCTSGIIITLFIILIIISSWLILWIYHRYSLFQFTWLFFVVALSSIDCTARAFHCSYFALALRRAT